MTKENKIIDDEIYEEKPTQEKIIYIAYMQGNNLRLLVILFF